MVLRASSVDSAASGLIPPHNGCSRSTSRKHGAAAMERLYVTLSRPDSVVGENERERQKMVGDPVVVIVVGFHSSQSRKRIFKDGVDVE